MNKKEIAEFVAKLDALDGTDPELAHAIADDILMKCVPSDILDAYIRLQERASDWWFG